ncbi:hypothetical protein IC229_23735 [Spirosoma sp. BT702]|uniref:Uncharacterized protein n=1 Tax=Spirosoma profusum TaxID=2771354 RepID=A0A927AUD1_9BACT|nr:hypothetical protein [Spirosoma profusum]MBD2703677.1 hypothetical protein [Spirosoma profusum]
MEQETKRRGRHKKPDASKKKAHQVYATDSEWQQIVSRAGEAGKEISPYIIEKALT